MMTESDKERFNNRLCVGNLLVSADVYVTPGMTEKIGRASCRERVSSPV